MLLSLEQLVAEVRVSRGELMAWIEERWVVPVEDRGELKFDEADRARVQLIQELRGDLGVNDDAIPVILKLLDQVYSLRRTLSELHDAIELLPTDAKAQLDAHLKKGSGS